MASINPRATRSNRGSHPDLDPDSGELRPDVELPLERREFHRMRQDPQRWASFMDGVAERQRREHVDVQAQVAGRVYDGDAYDAFQQYQQDLQWARVYANRDNELTSYDVERMSPAEFDAAFDEHARPREGYSFRPTSRDVATDAEAGVDRYSRGELGSNR